MNNCGIPAIAGMKNRFLAALEMANSKKQDVKETT